jgi:retron-type reverse transcriptase
MCWKISAPVVYVTYRESTAPWKHNITFPTYHCCHDVITAIRRLALRAEEYYSENDEE